MKNMTIVIVSTCMTILALTTTAYGNHQGFDCVVCHDEQATRNIAQIREIIQTPNSGPREVWFTAYEGWQSFADGEGPIDGVCEVCHTVTAYHRNNPSAPGGDHFSGSDCRLCHPRENDFLAVFPGQQSHETHLATYADPKGPTINDCHGCHDPSDYSVFLDGNPLAATTVCDTCHSPGGAFDGVGDLNPANPDSVAYGAKYNWQDGIYEESGDTLKPEKKDWCAGCHDNGTSVINSVQAPNVMGDNATYGYNVSGHGRNPSASLRCAHCHDLTVAHVDGNARTYSAAVNNYRDGYRLNEDMAVPRDGEVHPQAFRLCTNCHDYAEITGPYSNFRDDAEGRQYHQIHLEWWPGMLVSDSDFDGTGCSAGTCIDSAMTCINCHNVHGSPTPAMIRHGELISTPGTSDKVPALDFQWYKADGSTPTTMLQESRYGSLKCGLQPDVSFNHVCTGCHSTGRLYHYRFPLLCRCNMAPDATVISRGEPIGFQATVTNNFDLMGTVYFVTFLTPPAPYVRYPASGWLDFYELLMTSYEAKSGHISHTIPATWPLGTYTYHGYVGRPGPVIYDECTFGFDVVEP